MNEPVVRIEARPVYVITYGDRKKIVCPSREEAEYELSKMLHFSWLYSWKDAYKKAHRMLDALQPPPGDIYGGSK